MNIHITSTPEISIELIQSVCNELNQTNGVLKFKSGEPLLKEDMDIFHFTSYEPNQQTIGSFEDFFLMCQVYRRFNRVDNDDFVVLLTSIRNQSNWFSATEGRNIFIDVNDWEAYTGKNPKYGISYQVIENIFQSLIGIFHNNAEKHPNVHFDYEGCINDFCDDKRKVTIKLRMADICPSCQAKARELDVDWGVMNHIQGIMENIRINVRNLNTFNEVKLVNVSVARDGSVKIGNIEVSMKELPLTLFIFFLKQHAPISKTRLKSLERDLLRIYEKVKGRGNDGTIERLVDPSGKAFRQNKWHVNKALGDKLSESLLSYYIIDDVDEKKYVIHLSPELRSVHPDFSAPVS